MNKVIDYSQVSVKDKLNLLSCGYIGKYFASKNRNPNDIACIIVQFLLYIWKFDIVHFEYCCNRYTKSNGHGISNDGKTVRCDCVSDGIWSHRCYSLYRVSFGMKPNSGIYEIRMKIDAINNDNHWSAIGITIAGIDDTRNYWGFNNKYLGWSSFGPCANKSFLNMKNGLLIGATSGGLDVQDNIFIKSKFMYKSNNQYYKNGLPNIKTGDTIIMKYDSNNRILSFYKSNDVKLDAQISNLPNDKTLYWFAGRYSTELSVTSIE